MESAYTQPDSAITAISVVPPPISTTIEPLASCTGNPAPIAAAIGSSSNKALFAPADSTASRIARRSTKVDLQGTQTITFGLAKKRLTFTLLIKCLSIFWVTSKSAITPSLSGRIAVILSGVRPSICLASKPTAATVGFWVRLLRSATTVGSLRTTPLPGVKINVLAVPRSMAILLDKNPKRLMYHFPVITKLHCKQSRN